MIDKYTSANAVSDFIALLPLSEQFFKEHRLLQRCGICNRTLSKIHSYLASDTRIALICNTCNSESSCHPDAPSVELSDNPAITISALRQEVIHSQAKVFGYPLVMKPLLLDGNMHSAIVFTEDKAYATFVPWLPNDNLIISGELAIDALVIAKSIAAGLTKIIRIKNIFWPLSSDPNVRALLCLSTGDK